MKAKGYDTPVFNKRVCLRKKSSGTNSRTPEPIRTTKEEEENKLAILDLELNIKQETKED